MSESVEFSALSWPLSFPALSCHVSLSAKPRMRCFLGSPWLPVKSSPFCTLFQPHFPFLCPWNLPVCFLLHECCVHADLAAWKPSPYSWSISSSPSDLSRNVLRKPPNKSPRLPAFTELWHFLLQKLLLLSILICFRAHHCELITYHSDILMEGNLTLAHKVMYRWCVIELYT